MVKAERLDEAGPCHKTPFFEDPAQTVMEGFVTEAPRKRKEPDIADPDAKTGRLAQYDFRWFPQTTLETCGVAVPESRQVQPKKPLSSGPMKQARLDFSRAAAPSNSKKKTPVMLQSKIPPKPLAPVGAVCSESTVILSETEVSQKMVELRQFLSETNNGGACGILKELASAQIKFRTMNATGVHLEVQKLRKHPSLKVSALATSIVDKWKRLPRV